MYSIFTLLCCLALFSHIPARAEDSRLRIRSPRLLDLADLGISSVNDIENIPSLDYSPPPPSLSSDYASLSSSEIKEGEPEVEPEEEVLEPEEEALEPEEEVLEPEEEVLEPSLPTDPIESTEAPTPEDKPSQQITWAVPVENHDPKISGVANTNTTAPDALTDSAFSQNIAHTSVTSESSSAYGAAPTFSSDSNAGLLSASTSLLVVPTPSTVLSQAAIASATTQASASIGGDLQTNSSMIASIESTTTELASSPTSLVVSQSSSINDIESSSTSGIALTGTGQVSSTQALPGTAASDAPYVGTSTGLYNSTSTSIDLAPVTETSSSYGTSSTLAPIDLSSTSFSLSSTYQASATFSSSSLSGANATQTYVTSSSSLYTTSNTLLPTSLEPLPLPANSSTVYTDTRTFTTSGTAIYTSFTQSPSPAPITSNSTASSSFSTITVPQLTTSYTPPQQTSSLSSNSTYTPPTPNNATSYSPLPSSTKTYSPTTGSTSAPTVIMPTATNTASTFIPSSIIAQTSSTYTTGQSSSKSTGIPSVLPKIVQNPLSSSTPSQPVDTSEVQIGFEWALNYPFVVSHPLSTTQIFTYLPIGIADGLGLKPEQIVVKNLLPLDTTAELQFITTVARVFIPSSMVDTLRVDLGVAASPIYQNPDESVNTLMNYINPAIPFFPGAVLDPGSLQTGTNDQATHTSTPGDAGVFNTGTQQSQSATAKGTTAGIALAACGGAAAYGAAMFLLARRYKHRQQRHKQPNLMENSSDFYDDGDRSISPVQCSDSGALMTGGRITPSLDRNSRGSGRTGQSTRNAQISAPVRTENSLGWN